MKTSLSNRIIKNHKKLAKQFSNDQIEAYRLYDRDIPEAQVIVDVYKDHIVVFERFHDIKDSPEKQQDVREDLKETLKELGFKESKIIFKKRRIQKGKSQYEKISRSGDVFKILEKDCFYAVNLTDYLDTGLFLDHRPMRTKIKKTDYKNKDFLNLFAYTGSVSVAAAKAGATVTSVDTSNTYLKWAEENFRLNDLKPDRHLFICEDVIKFLKRSTPEKYDCIFLDPPTFSNSKKFEGTFDIQRDHPFLIEICLGKLKKGGMLYFSNNRRDFKLEDSLKDIAHIKDTSLNTIPIDFRDKKIHNCFEITHKE